MENEHPLVQLARKTIERYVQVHKTMQPPSELIPEMAEQAGVFVSLHKQGALRGCIGTIEPLTPSLAEEIVQNAISASTRDPRFPPVTVAELDKLSVSVDVLSEPRPAKESELDPKRYGLIIEQGYRRGLLLPDLEGVDDVRTQKSIVAQKGGIDLMRPHNLLIFTVDRYA